MSSSDNTSIFNNKCDEERKQEEEGGGGYEYDDDVGGDEDYDYSHVENGDENDRLHNYYYCYTVPCFFDEDLNHDHHNNHNNDIESLASTKYWKKLANQFIGQWQFNLQAGGMSRSNRYLVGDI